MILIRRRGHICSFLPSDLLPRIKTALSCRFRRQEWVPGERGRPAAAPPPDARASDRVWKGPLLAWESRCGPALAKQLGVGVRLSGGPCRVPGSGLGPDTEQSRAQAGYSCGVRVLEGRRGQMW